MKKSIFDEPKPWYIGKSGLLLKMEHMIDAGYDISSIDVGGKRYEWIDIYQDLYKFMNDFKKHDIVGVVLIVWLKVSTAEFLYDLYEVLPVDVQRFE